jgi:hypothetical protein
MNTRSCLTEPGRLSISDAHCEGLFLCIVCAVHDVCASWSMIKDGVHLSSFGTLQRMLWDPSCMKLFEIGAEEEQKDC